MNTINVVTTTGEMVKITEQEFLKTGIAYLRQYSPDRIKIVAEETNDSGQLKTKPAAVFMLLKNPDDVVYYTDVVEIEKQE